MSLGLLGLAAPAAHAANPVPYPAALAGHPFATEWSLSTMAGSTWTPTNNPGNCPANPGAVSLQPGFVQINANGVSGNCAAIESPHTYPTVNGYVYEAKIDASTDANWSADWAYGDNWPNHGEIDATEFNDEVNYVSWHQAGTNGCTQDEWSTNPWTYNCKSNLTPVAGVANFAPHQWVIVDYAFTSTGVDVYYNGKLYAHVPESVTQDGSSPMWLTFGTGSCHSNNNGDTCAVPSDATVAGNFSIAYFRAFT
jgi:hypothetical protein